ncbi:MAG: hypothetical protein AAFU84_06865 [Cyanobacteria bacterium J06633_23]
MTVCSKATNANGVFLDELDPSQSVTLGLVKLTVESTLAVPLPWASI